MIHWTHWPAQQQPARSLAAAGVVIASVVGFTKVGWVYGVLAAAVLLTTTAESLLPTRFRLTEEGVEAFNYFRHVRRPWSRFESWRSSDQGYYLRGRGPLPWIARRRSLPLPCPNRHLEVGAFLTARLREAP